MSNFYHDDQTVRRIIDARDNPSAAIQPCDVFYTGYRVSIGNAQWYHHAILLADGAVSLTGGIAALSDQIRHELGFDAAIVPVFLRSMMTEDEDVIDSAYRADIAQEIKQMLAARRDDRYLVFGIVGDSQITLMNIEGGNVLDVVIAAVQATQEQHGKDFFPLDVCQAHQVTEEFASRFAAATRRISALIDMSSAQASAPH